MNRPVVSRIEFLDAPHFSGPILKQDGRLVIVSEGKGLAVGPMSPDQLRAFAQQAADLADRLEQQHRSVSANVGAELAAIVAKGSA